jgi:hypothetical protein
VAIGSAHCVLHSVLRDTAATGTRGTCLLPAEDYRPKASVNAIVDSSYVNNFKLSSSLPECSHLRRGLILRSQPSSSLRERSHSCEKGTYFTWFFKPTHRHIELSKYYRFTIPVFFCVHLCMSIRDTPVPPNSPDARMP